MTNRSPSPHHRSAPPVRKRFGQHFLEPAWVGKVVRAIDPQADQTFIEIGPGRAALTRPLSSRAKQIVAYEIDRDLARELRDANLPNVTVVEGDFLDHDLTASEWPAASNGAVRVAGNLPYNVASPILFKLVDAHLAGVPIVDATVMLQREVADRLLAKPGTKEYGVLTILIGHAASVERVLNLPPGAFRPPPKVQSSVVRLTFHAPDPPVRDRAVFVELVQSVFTRRRKTLSNALFAFRDPSVPGTVPGMVPGIVPGTEAAGIDGTRRPETLTIAEFARLADVFSSR